MAKIVLVTGASSGIGEASVRRLLAEGHVVYAAARRVGRMRPLADAGARLLALDLTDDTSIIDAIDAIEKTDGRLDVLINNAGYGSYGALEDVPMDEARRQFEVNVFGLARLIQQVLPMMRAQRSGTLVNITSIGGKMHEPMGSWYHATKFAVEGLSDCLRMELAPFGIQVVVVEPGAIRTEWSGIARNSLLEHSGQTAYAAQAQAHARMLAASDTSSMASPRTWWRARLSARCGQGGHARATPPAAAHARFCCFVACSATAPSMRQCGWPKEHCAEVTSRVNRWPTARPTRCDAAQQTAL